VRIWENDTPERVKYMAKDSALQKVTDVRAAIEARLAFDNDRDSGDDVMNAIAQEIFAAESADDVLSTGGTLGAEDLLNVPIRLEDFRLRPSNDEFPDTIAFAVVNAARMDTEEIIIFTTGAYNIVTALIKFDLLNAFPVECHIGAAGRALRLFKVPHTTLAVDAQSA